MAEPLSKSLPAPRPLRVAIATTEASRRSALAKLVSALGHQIVEARVADVVVADADGDGLAATLDSVAAQIFCRADNQPSDGFAPIEEEETAPLLTPREMEVLLALSEGESNKEIARRFDISRHTVKFHVESIFRKLGVTTRAEAVAKGLRRGLVNL